MGDETTLLEQARQGSKEAFTGLLRLHQGRVRAYLGRHLRSQDMADDLAQEVFLVAYRTLSTYRGEVPLVLWLLGIARHLCLTFLRGEARRRAREGRSLEGALATWRAEAMEPGTSPVSEDDRRIVALRECLKRLPPKSASMVRQRYFQQMSVGDMASGLGTSENVVRVTLVRIRSVLRQCVDQQSAYEWS